MPNYWEAQWHKIRFIKELQQKHQCLVLQPGDFFDHWKPSPRLLAMTFLNTPNNILTIYGNHDLPQHSLQFRDKSGLYAIAVGAPDKVRLVCQGKLIGIKDRTITLLHTPVYESQVPPWHTDAMTARACLARTDYDLIVTGDIHDRFVVSYRDRLLVNAGSMMRMTADQINHIPAVYLWYAEDNSVEEVLLPAVPGVISREHLERQEEREKRYEAFIQRLKQEGRPELSFKANLEQHFRQNSTLPSVKRLIYQMMEEG